MAGSYPHTDEASKWKENFEKEERELVNYKHQLLNDKNDQIMQLKEETQLMKKK